MKKSTVEIIRGDVLRIRTTERLSWRAIARRLGVSDMTVLRAADVLRDEGHDLPACGVASRHRADAIKMRAETGWSARVIAAELGLKEKTVEDRLVQARRRGLHLPSAKVKAADDKAGVVRAMRAKGATIVEVMAATGLSRAVVDRLRDRKAEAEARKKGIVDKTALVRLRNKYKYSDGLGYGNIGAEIVLSGMTIAEAEDLLLGAAETSNNVAEYLLNTWRAARKDADNGV